MAYSKIIMTRLDDLLKSKSPMRDLLVIIDEFRPDTRESEEWQTEVYNQYFDTLEELRVMRYNGENGHRIALSAAYFYLLRNGTKKYCKGADK